MRDTLNLWPRLWDAKHRDDLDGPTVSHRSLHPQWSGVLALTLMLAAMGACGDKPERSFGKTPLAVLKSDETGSSEASGGTGAVEITADCASLVTAREKVLLIWRSNEVEWDAADEVIKFTSRSERDSKTLHIREGDVISIGGEALSDEPGPEFVERNLEWVSRPRPECAGIKFIVNNVRRE